MRSSLFFYLGLCIILTVRCLPRQDLYPFGEDVGDNRLQPDDDASSSAIDLQIPISFYDDTFYSIYVSICLLLCFFFTSSEIY